MQGTRLSKTCIEPRGQRLTSPVRSKNSHPRLPGACGVLERLPWLVGAKSARRPSLPKHREDWRPVTSTRCVLSRVYGPVVRRQGKPNSSPEEDARPREKPGLYAEKAKALTDAERLQPGCVRNAWIDPNLNVLYAFSRVSSTVERGCQETQRTMKRSSLRDW